MRTQQIYLHVCACLCVHVFTRLNFDKHLFNKLQNETLILTDNNEKVNRSRYSVSKRFLKMCYETNC